MRIKPSRRVGVFSRIREGVDDALDATPARFAVITFGALVLVFTLLFLLPAATASGERASFVDALFSSVSVVSLTGLSTVDMATYWSPLGHVFVALGVEIGTIGVLTLASILGLVISRRLGLRQKLLAGGDTTMLKMRRWPLTESQAARLGEAGSLLVTVTVVVVAAQVILTVLLLPRMLIAGVPFGEALWQSGYYAVMSFGNAGFLPTADGLAPYAGDAWFLGVLMIGAIVGSIGFPVIYVIARHRRDPHRWSLHVKLTILTSALLLVLGALAYLVLEFGNPATFQGMDGGQRVLQSFFLSTMTRSGGFSTIDMSQLDSSSKLVTDMLMFIGGGSASTAGGIKVTTLAVLFLAAFAEARGSFDMEAHRRKIPQDVLRLAVSVVLWGATIIAIASIVLLTITDATLDDVLFDVISAFGTAGLSSGFTASTNDAAQIVIAVMMFLGRVGTVTIAAAFAASQRRQLFNRAEERPIVG